MSFSPESLNSIRIGVLVVEVVHRRQQTDVDDASQDDEDVVVGGAIDAAFGHPSVGNGVAAVAVVVGNCHVDACVVVAVAVTDHRQEMLACCP